MYINLEVLFFITGGIAVFLWWYFRKNIQDGANSRKELLVAINELRNAIEKLSDAQILTNEKLIKLQTQHDMVINAGKVLASHQFTPE